MMEAISGSNNNVAALSAVNKCGRKILLLSYSSRLPHKLLRPCVFLFLRYVCVVGEVRGGFVRVN